MKKVLAVLFVAVFAPCVFAGQNPAAAFEKAVEQAAVKATAAQQDKVAEAKQQLKTSLKGFAEFASKQHYANFNFMFQSLDHVRQAYVDLRSLSVDAAREMVKEVNAPIVIDNGKNKIRIADYVRMESCVLGSYSQREEALWITWSNMLEEDLKAVPNKNGVVTADTQLDKNLPQAFATSVKGFRSYVGKAKTMNPNWVLQSMMNVMDTFNEYKNDPAAAKAMAKEFVKPVQGGWGGVVYPTTFIVDHACELYGPVQTELEQFAADLRKLSR